MAQARVRKSKKEPRQKAIRPGDEGNATTRQRLVEVAGQIFAEKGFERTTSKEITERAGANVAAVNYHFRGIEGLYAAVLEEAGSMLVRSDDMKVAVDEQLDPKAKLEAFLGPFIQVLLGPAASSWRLRVIVRELTSPTLTANSPREKERLQKTQILKGIVSELMGLPENHPAVARGCISVLAPCALLLLTDRAMLKRSYPNLGLKPNEAPILIQHMVQFSLAGLTAVAHEVKHGKDD
jgi:AcrR family transcriptional regulator